MVFETILNMIHHPYFTISKNMSGNNHPDTIPDHDRKLSRRVGDKEHKLDNTLYEDAVFDAYSNGYMPKNAALTETTVKLCSRGAHLGQTWRQRANAQPLTITRH